MQHLDLQVIEQSLTWLRAGETVWLCTVLATFGSSPREPGSLLAARRDGSHVGSLSGGCVEEDFLERLRRVGGLSEAEVARLHMPVGLALGSKTPAEIALATIADIVRVYRGRLRDAL